MKRHGIWRLSSRGPRPVRKRSLQRTGPSPQRPRDRRKSCLRIRRVDSPRHAAIRCQRHFLPPRNRDGFLGVKIARGRGHQSSSHRNTSTHAIGVHTDPSRRSLVRIEPALEVRRWAPHSCCARTRSASGVSTSRRQWARVHVIVKFRLRPSARMRIADRVPLRVVVRGNGTCRLSAPGLTLGLWPQTILSQ